MFLVFRQTNLIHESASIFSSMEDFYIHVHVTAGGGGGVGGGGVESESITIINGFFHCDIDHHYIITKHHHPRKFSPEIDMIGHKCAETWA